MHQRNLSPINSSGSERDGAFSLFARALESVANGASDNSSEARSYLYLLIKHATVTRFLLQMWPHDITVMTNFFMDVCCGDDVDADLEACSVTLEILKSATPGMAG